MHGEWLQQAKLRQDGAVNRSDLSLRRASGGPALFTLLLAACVTPTQSAPPPVLAPSPEVQPAASTPSSPGSAAGAAQSSGTEPPTPGSAKPTLPNWPTLPARLPWVNPSRCLPSCAFDPGASGQDMLVSVNAKGEAEVRGRLRIHRDIVDPLRALLAAAQAAGHALRIESAYRSYRDQERLFATIKEAGRAARPGHSEHQLGTTVDLRLPTGAAIRWLADHAAEHGFALSYPAGKQRITGYRPEPWHIRYVGRELAAALSERGLSLEEAFREKPELGESGGCGDCPSPASQAACGPVKEAGECRGSVLFWCYDGVLASVDCATSGEQCGSSRPGGESMCLASPSGPSTPAQTSQTGTVPQ